MATQWDDISYETTKYMSRVTCDALPDTGYGSPQTPSEVAVAVRARRGEYLGRMNRRGNEVSVSTPRLRVSWDVLADGLGDAARRDAGIS